MDSPNVNARAASQQIAPADRQLRMAEETALIAEADAALEAGPYIESADVKRWIDSIGTDHETAPPKARGR